MALNVIQIFFYVLRLFAVILLFLFFFWAYSENLEIFYENEIDKANMEIAENLFNSPLTVNRTIFSFAELNKFSGTKQEPYARHLKFGYFLEIESLDKQNYCSGPLHDEDCKSFCMSVCEIPEDEIKYTGLAVGGNCDCTVSKICQCQKDNKWISKNDLKWSFGYQPIEKTIFSSTKTYPVAVDMNGEIIPAKMTLTLYDSYTTEFTDVIEKALETMETQEILLLTKHLDDIKNVKKKGEGEKIEICIQYYKFKKLDCRDVRNTVSKDAVIKYTITNQQIDNLDSNIHSLVEFVPSGNKVTIQLKSLVI